jgi:predicted ferric reductase
MRDSTKKWLWLLLYFAVLLAPLIVIMIGPRPAPREFWRELSVALGFTGLALVGVQFIPTSRLRVFSNLFSMDEVYYYHARAAVVGFVLIVAHPLILILFNPTTVRLLNPLTAPERAVFGLVALLALITLIVTSIFRKQLGIKYEVWRVIHALSAVLMVLTAMGHMLLVDYYLSTLAQQILWISLAVVWMGLILNNWLAKPLRQTQQPYRISELHQEVKGVWRMKLTPDDHPGIRFIPGQFAWLSIRRPAFTLRQHPFSIASSAEDMSSLEFAIGEAGDFTSKLGQIPVGTVVYLDGPHGAFSIDKRPGPGYVFIAGGIGSPPLMSMLRTMADRQDKTPTWLFYGNVDLDSIAFEEELLALEQTLNLRVIHVLEEAPDDWEGETGFITAEVLERHLPDNRNDLIYFMCGPIPMINAVESALIEINVPLENVYTEQYDLV